MGDSPPAGADAARVALGVVRLTFGTIGLVAPGLLQRRVGGVADVGPAAIYAARMFGIRTVLIGLQLLREDGPERRDALLTAPIVHLSDTLTATALVLSHKVSVRTGLPLIAVSGANTALALLARRAVRP